MIRGVLAWKVFLLSFVIPHNHVNCVKPGNAKIQSKAQWRQKIHNVCWNFPVPAFEGEQSIDLGQSQPLGKIDGSWIVFYRFQSGRIYWFPGTCSKCNKMFRLCSFDHQPRNLIGFWIDRFKIAKKRQRIQIQIPNSLNHTFNGFHGFFHPFRWQF